jgi:hypothetical protein
VPGPCAAGPAPLLVPERRVRTKARIVKRAISKYNARGPHIDRTTYKATTEINILAAGP